MNKALVVALILVFAFVPVALAAQNVWDMAASDRYGKKVGGMLGRGFLNIGTCFVDLLVQTVEKTKQGPPIVGTMTGLGAGLGCSALRVSSGAVDVLTFWVPGFNGFPVSRSYRDCTDMGETSTTSHTESAGAGYPGTSYSAPASSGSYPSATAYEEPAPVRQDPMRYVKK